MTVEVGITGVGVTSPLGCGGGAAFGAALQGECGVSVLPPEVWSDVPVRLWATVRDDLVPEVAEHERTAHDRSILLGLSAVRQAWAMAGRPAVDPSRFAVSMSSGMGPFLALDASLRRFYVNGPRSTTAFTVPRMMPNALAAVTAIELGACGGTYSFVSACSSGADSIAHALRLLRSGEADVVVSGGSEAPLHPSVAVSFDKLRTLSRERTDPRHGCRPFDRSRAGFVLGEGAGVLVLERLDHARARGARPLAVLAGAGVTSDAAHVVAPDPSGRMAALAMRRALESGGLGPADVAGVSAHATGTRSGDDAEATALGLVFGDRVAEIPVTALKSMIGHLVGASGAVAAALAAVGMAPGRLAPTLGFDCADEGSRLDVVHGEPRSLPERGAGVVLVNCFGFGGQNISLCIGRADAA